MKRLYILGNYSNRFGFLLGLLLLTSACSEQRQAPPALIRPVKTITLASPAEFSQRSFSGRAVSSERASIGFRVPGKVEIVNVKVGDQVKSGQVLAVLDKRDYQFTVKDLENSIAQAQANLTAMEAGARQEDRLSLESALQAAKAHLDEASKNFERAQRLVKDSMINQADYDRARSMFEEAKAGKENAQQNLAKAVSGARKEEKDAVRAQMASLEAKLGTARAALQDTELKAPFDGSISERRIEPHEQVMAQMPIFSLENTGKIEIKVGIPEDYVIFRDRITSIKARFEAMQNRILPAQVKEYGVRATLDSQTYTTTVIVDNPAGDIKPGMTAEVTFIVTLEGTFAADMYMVPLTAVFEEEQKKWVWIFDPPTGTVHRKAVTVEHPDLSNEQIPIKGDVKAGDIIVIAGVHYLKEGQKVRKLADSVTSGAAQ